MSYWTCETCNRTDLSCMVGKQCESCYCKTLPGSYACRECGLCYNISRTSAKLREGLCFTCDFWQGYVEQKDDPRILRIGGVHYVDLGPERGDGFGGSLFRYRRKGAGDVVETRNMWHQGTIPSHFQDRLPDNAEFIHAR